MMEISQQLKDKAVSAFREQEPSMLEYISNGKFTAEIIHFPFFFDFIMDTAVYSTKENRFISIIINVATKNYIQSDMLPDGSVFCDWQDIELVTIEL